MSENETVARLQSLGLNLYESRAYLALLAAKQLTAKGVGQSALIPQSRTYDVLESLTTKGFAVATPASPPVYAPVPPAGILKSCYNSEKRRIQDRAARHEEEAQAQLDNVRGAYEALLKDLSSLTDKSSSIQERVWVLRERKNIENTVIGLIKEAKSQVLRITKPPQAKSREQFDPFYVVGLENQKFVFDALERNVKMRWLGLAREIPTFVGLEVSEPPERRYLENDDDITEKFFLVDDHSVILNLHDPMSPAYGSVALVIQSKAACSIFQEHFERMWERGKPLDDVLPRTKSLVDEACAAFKDIGLSRSEALLFRTMAKIGANSQDVISREMLKKKVELRDTIASRDRLMRSGFVHYDNDLKLLMVEHPANVVATITRGKPEDRKVAGLTTR